MIHASDSTATAAGAATDPRAKSPLHDVQSGSDHRELPIDKVGVRGLRFPIQIRDKAHQHQNTIATMSMCVDLPKEFKGTHMSRFIEVLNAHGAVVHVENIEDILHAMQAKLHAATAHLEMEFPFFLTKKAPVTGKEGVMDYTARFAATACGKEIDFILTVIVGVTTLCPCSKAISKYSAHNQRGNVTVAIRSDKVVWIEDLIALVEQVVDVDASGGEELRVLLAKDTIAQNAASHGMPPVLVGAAPVRLGARLGRNSIETARAKNFSMCLLELASSKLFK